MLSKVALMPCAGYDREEVYQAVKTGIDLLGGIERFAAPDERILVKANLLCGAEPEKAVTTHPAVFGAVLRCLREAGCSDVKYGDSPGSPLENMANTAKKCGLADAAEEYGAEFGRFDEHRRVEYPEGIAAKSFELCEAVSDADTIIEVCKMKTHALENITGAVKNQYGFVYGAHKAKGHAAYPDSFRFAEMIADLNKCVGVRLHVMDGVVAMEGNGPASGTPKEMNVILISEDPVALDTVFARLVYLDPEYVPTCIAGEKAGLGTMDTGNIEIITPDGVISAVEAAGKYGDPTFDVERRQRNFWKIPLIGGLVNKLTGGRRDRPEVDREKCIGCGVCQDVCPVEGAAVRSGKGRKAVYDYSRCIRCYCCQEMCPARAIYKRNKGKSSIEQ